MPISPYVRKLRERIGRERLLLPSVSALIRDPSGALLLVRQSDDGAWSTPGGVIEPDETPADAVVREAWEETGLLVQPVRIAAVHGGPAFVVRYPNGDESQYVIIAFECTIRGGRPRADDEETLEVRFWRAEEAQRLQLAPWLREVLPSYFTWGGSQTFVPASWKPSDELG